MELLISVDEAQLTLCAIFVFPFSTFHLLSMGQRAVYIFIDKMVYGGTHAAEKNLWKHLSEMFSTAHRHRVSNIVNDFLAP